MSSYHTGWASPGGITLTATRSLFGPGTTIRPILSPFLRRMPERVGVPRPLDRQAERPHQLVAELRAGPALEQLQLHLQLEVIGPPRQPVRLGDADLPLPPGVLDGGAEADGVRLFVAGLRL